MIRRDIIIYLRDQEKTKFEGFIRKEKNDAFWMFFAVINLMSSALKLQRQIAHLEQQDFKKLFPEQYYSKYGTHQKVKDFQHALLHQTHEPRHTTRSTSVLRKSTPQLSTNRGTVTKLRKADDPEDVIAKNKEQTKRMQHFVKDLNVKLKNGPASSTSKIRTPLNGFGEIGNGVFDRLKLLEDAQYEAELQYMRQKKRKTGEYVNFMPRNRNHSQSAAQLKTKKSRSIAGESIQSKQIKDHFNMSNTMLLHSLGPPLSQNFPMPSLAHTSLNYDQKVLDILNKTRSQISPLNPESKTTQLKCIMFMNRSLKQMNNLKIQLSNQARRQQLGKSLVKSKVVSSDMRRTSGKKKDLIAMTQKIRREGDQMEVISIYENAIAQRKLKEKLKIQ